MHFLRKYFVLLKHRNLVDSTRSYCSNLNDTSRFSVLNCDIIIGLINVFSLGLNNHCKYNF